MFPAPSVLFHATCSSIPSRSTKTSKPSPTPSIWSAEPTNSQRAKTSQSKRPVAFCKRIQASSLFFALVLSPALKAADTVLKNGLLFALIDDVTIASPAEQVAAAFQAFNPFSSSPVFASTPPNLSSVHWTFQILRHCRNNFSNSRRRPKESLSLARL